jgi:sensor domain DACNV-containing protein
VLVHLLTTIFFAGLETYEGERNPIGVVFFGKSLADFVMPKDAALGAAPLYQWKILRFSSPRPFAINELVKLAVAGANARIYSAVHVLTDGALAITGLAHEGFNAGQDPFIRIVASRPGALSIRSGRDLVVGYDRGTILSGGADRVFSASPVRRALEAAARAAGCDDEVVPDYIDAVRSLVQGMAAHGRGGILIVSREADLRPGVSATYEMTHESSLTSLLRLAHRIGRMKPTSSSPGPPVTGTAAGDASLPFGRLLHEAFRAEADRVIKEVSALTGIDGAILLNCDLAMVAFGVILPVGHPPPVVAATDDRGWKRTLDLGSRGTRHRASATYAAQHPGSVVFVASEDGPVSCLLCESPDDHVLLWRLSPTDIHIS